MCRSDDIRLCMGQRQRPANTLTALQVLPSPLYQPRFAFLARLARHSLLGGTANIQEPHIPHGSEVSAGSSEAAVGEVPAQCTQQNICDLQNNLQGTMEMDFKGREGADRSYMY